jgi:hypothetical protein
MRWGASASWRMPLTCRETFTLGLSVRMVNWLWLTLGSDDGLPESVQSRYRRSGSALRTHYSERLKDHGVTVKVAALVAFPPAVVIAILPVTAPVGTVAVISVSEFTVNVVAFTRPKTTFVP